MVLATGTWLGATRPRPVRGLRARSAPVDGPPSGSSSRRLSFGGFIETEDRRRRRDAGRPGNDPVGGAEYCSGSPRSRGTIGRGPGAAQSGTAVRHTQSSAWCSAGSVCALHLSMCRLLCPDVPPTGGAAQVVELEGPDIALKARHSSPWATPRVLVSFLRTAHLIAGGGPARLDSRSVVAGVHGLLGGAMIWLSNTSRAAAM